jgi:hypothetical protein
VRCDCDVTGAILYVEVVLDAVYAKPTSAPERGRKVVALNPPPNPRITKAILDGEGGCRMLTEWEIETLRREGKEIGARLMARFKRKKREREEGG